MKNKFVLVVICTALFALIVFSLFLGKDGSIHRPSRVGSLVSFIPKSKVPIVPTKKREGLFLDIGTTSIRLIEASTPEARERGLGARDRLDQNVGMLFTFNEPGMYEFWMKDMRFGIDIIWLDTDGRIVTIKRNVAPLTYPKVFGPSAPSLSVIELNAGRSLSLDLKEGDLLTISRDK
jgi:uncharacterized membrane protein (UPF0127 family)